jgi:hypothetical protein
MSDLAVTFIKSTYCADQACIEVASSYDDILVRDGKHRDQPFLRFSRAEWGAFLDGIAAGEFRSL